MKSSLPTIAIVTRLSRSNLFLERVLEGLLLQTGAALFWSIVTQTRLTKEHMSCLERAKSNGIAVKITKAKKGISLGKLANVGVNSTSTEFVMLHDDDDSLNRDFIGPAMKFLMQNNIIGIACHAAIICENNGKNQLELVLSPGKEKICRSDVLFDNKIVTNGLIYRRNAYNLTAGYPEDVDVAEDWMFYISLLELGQFEIYPKVCANVFIRNNVGSDTSISNTDRKQHELMRDRIRAMGGLTEVQPKPQKMYIIKHKVLRAIDRIIFKISGKFLPR